MSITETTIDILLTAITDTTMEMMNQFLTSFSESAEIKSSLNNFLASLSMAFSIIIASLLFVSGTRVPKKNYSRILDMKTDDHRIPQYFEFNPAQKKELKVSTHHYYF